MSTDPTIPHPGLNVYKSALAARDHLLDQQVVALEHARGDAMNRDDKKAALDYATEQHSHRIAAGAEALTPNDHDNHVRAALELKSSIARLAVELDMADRKHERTATRVNEVRAKLAAAELALSKADDALRLTHAEEVASEFNAMHETLTRIGGELRALTGVGLSMPRHTRLQVFSESIETALAHVPNIDPLHTPVNELRGGGGVDEGLWAARRAALLASADAAGGDGKNQGVLAA